MPQTEVFLDDSRALTVEEIHANADFHQSNAQSLNFGFTKARVWMRFRIHNTLPVPQYRILYLRHFLFDEIVLYSQLDDEFSAQYSGRLHLDEHNKTALPTRFFHFEITIPPNTNRLYYLAVDSEDAMSSAVNLVSRDQFQRVMIHDTIAITFYAGLMLTNLLFAIFMLAKLREIQLLYYLGFLVLHHLLGIMMLEGVPASLVDFENVFWNKTGFILLINAAVTMAVLFFRSFLRLKQEYPPYYQLSRVLLVLMLISTAQSVVLPHVIGSALTTIICMIVGAGIIYICFRCASTNNRLARLFLLAWSAGVLGATIYGLKLWGILPINAFTNHAWHIGSALEAILFSFIIADRVASERHMRLQTQMELVEQERAVRVAQEKLLKIETAAKRELEQQVHERTKDITRILGELEKQNQQLTELSVNDALTKVRNRRFFNDAYPELWQEALTSGKSISVILLDIDHFKSVNDTYGHLVGDECLVAVAACLRNLISRPKDIICRYGGEEFIMVLFDTELQNAASVAERLRSTLAENRIDTDAGPLSVTASLGVAALIPTEQDEAKDLLARCDDALYQSKADGRNRVTLATPDHSDSSTA